jgi:hypothetical protein
MSAEDLLARTFSEVTEHTDYPSTPVATVLASAHDIRGRRRRRIAVVAAAAVVVVVGASAAMSLGHDDNTPPQPAGPLADLPKGDSPKIDYIDGDAFVTTSGRRVTSPAFSRAADAVAWGKGVLVASQPTSRHPFSSISFVSGGSTSNVGCGAPSFAISPDGGDPVYWLSSECKPRGGGRFVEGYTSRDTPKGATFVPVGKVASGIVSFATTSQLRLKSHALVVLPGDGHLIPLPLLVPRGASEAADLICGLVRNGQDSVVVDASTREAKWRARFWSLSRFSSSGRYVAGSQTVGEQTVQSVGDVVGIWDAATGHRVLRKVLPGLTFDTLPVWEGDASVLVVAHDRAGEQAIVRVGLDGTVSRATDVGDESSGGFKPASTP